MFLYENIFAKTIKEFQIKLLRNKDYQKKFNLFQKNIFEMNPSDLYSFTVSKWFYKFTNFFDYLENENIILNKYEVTETNIYSIYTTLCKDLRDHVINVATYHDLLLHLLDSVYEIKNDSKNLSWKLIEQGIQEERVKQQMNKIYSFMKKEIRYRNNVLHDMDFLWIDNYLSIEINQLCNLFVFEDNEMIKLLEPLKKELVIQLQNKIHHIQKEEKERFDNIQKETNKLFEFLYNPFNEKVKVLMK